MAIDVAPDVFGPAGDDPGCSNEHVIITAWSGKKAAGAALARAAGRFSGITEDGREPSDEEWQAIEAEARATGRDWPYTPNYVSDVEFAARGPWCYVDCKGYIWPAMRERMIAVLVEELERAGVSARIEVPSMNECYPKAAQPGGQDD